MCLSGGSSAGFQHLESSSAGAAAVSGAGGARGGSLPRHRVTLPARPREMWHAGEQR